MSNMLMGGVNQAEAACVQNEWAGYDLGFQAELLPKQAKLWLKKYLSYKYHKDEDYKIYQVLTKIATMLSDGSERTKDWWAEFLWQVGLVYRQIPDAAILNQLYGAISTPAYVRAINDFGESSSWKDKMADYALQHGMKTSEIALVMPDLVLDDSTEDLTEDPIGQRSENQGDDLKVVLEEIVPYWSPELIDWMVDIIKNLRENGLSVERGEALFRLIRRPNKTDLDYALIAILERPIVQYLLTKNDIGELTSVNVMQFLLELVTVNNGKLPSSTELGELSRLSLGFPLPADYRLALGSSNRKWLAKLQDAVDQGKITVHRLSRQAQFVYRQEFAIYRRVISYSLRGENLLAVTLEGVNDQDEGVLGETFVLDFRQAKKL